MASEKGNKLNRLQHLLPEGLLADTRWFEANGYSSALRSRYVTRGWLEQPARGVYRRPGGKLLWRHVVISLQNLLAVPVIVGGRTALALHGHSHAVANHGPREIHLYSAQRMPGWVGKLNLPVSFKSHNAKRLFRHEQISEMIGEIRWQPNEQMFTGFEPPSRSLVRVLWGQWDWPLTISTRERAVLELLDEVPTRETFYQADKLMDGLHALSPTRLQELLEDCRSVKVKRLLLWFAERHGFRWMSRLQKDRIDLGAGKRVIARDGRLDPTYLITVPRDLDAVQ